MRLLTNGMKIGNATVIVDIIQKGNAEIRPGRAMRAKYLTDHDTGNAGRGADAEMHNRYIHNMASYHPRDTSHVSWHLTVDEKYIYQHIPFDEIAWHCGDGTGPGNYSSVGVEKCMHAGSDRNKIEANAIALHAYLMKELNIPITNVKPHQSWSGKYCPALILNRYGSFTPFRNKIEAAFKGGPTVITVSNPISARDYLIEDDRGTAVSTMQADLNKAGASPKLVVDGIYGAASTAAVAAFQRKHKLAADGVFGKASKAKLAEVLKPAPKTKEDVTVATKPTPDNSPSAWAREDVELAVKLGITDGSRLHDAGTRQEMIVIIMRALDLAPRIK